MNESVIIRTGMLFGCDVWGRLGTKLLETAGLRPAFAAGRASHEKRAGAAIAMVCLLEARLGAKLLEAAGLRPAFAAGRASHKKSRAVRG